MTKTNFAAHDDLSIYAIGLTADEAIDRAKKDANDPGAKFQTTRIGELLADQIEAGGWNGNTQSFAVRNGQIVETTNE